jgi:hypothetical protein
MLIALELENRFLITTTITTINIIVDDNNINSDITTTYFQFRDLVRLHVNQLAYSFCPSFPKTFYEPTCVS